MIEEACRIRHSYNITASIYEVTLLTAPSIRYALKPVKAIFEISKFSFSSGNKELE